MTKQQTIAAVVIVLIILVLGGVFISLKQTVPPEGVACTMDALICPDGSGVGRTGPSCKFSACPSTGPLIGVYLSDAQGPRLAVASPEGVGTGASYAVPLASTSIALDQALIGTTITLEGNFIEGSTFRATGVASGGGSATSTAPGSSGSGTPPHASASTTVKVKVGETKFAGGVKITLNKIVSDSRCPVDAQCIWAGNVTASVTLQSDTDKETLDMVSMSAAHPFDSYQVSITDASPALRTNVRISADGYTLTFVVAPPASASLPPVSPPVASGKCYVGGCSAQLCSDTPDQVSNCMYNPQYACYKSATCERQATGDCGWTPSTELAMCLKEHAATTQTPQTY